MSADVLVLAMMTIFIRIVLYLEFCSFSEYSYISVKMSMASMEKHLFNLKFAAKELERNSKKCDKVI